MCARNLGLANDGALSFGSASMRVRGMLTVSAMTWEGVRAIHYVTEMSSKRGARNISTKTSGWSPVFST